MEKMVEKKLDENAARIADNNHVNERDKSMSDYLYVLYKWKRLIIIVVLLVAIGSGTFAFLLPQKFKSSAIVMIPPESSMGLGGLTSLLSGNKSSVGAKLFGMTSTSEDMLIGILNSRTANVDVIKKFKLISYYKQPNIDRTLRAFKEDVSFGMTDNGMIDISVENKDPEMSARIANYFVKILDSLNIKYSVEQARNNRMFLEKRYLKNLSDLKLAEDSLYRFQKKYGVFAVPQQLEVAVKAAAEIESKLAQAELAAQVVLGQYGENSPHYQGAITQVKMLKGKVNELKNSSHLSENSNVLFPFKQAPDMTIQYFRLFREIEVQQKILEVMLPMYEQTKFEEQKSIPAVIVVDAAVAPSLKDSPKRAFIIIGFSLVALFFMIILAFHAETSVNKKEFSNPLEKKENEFFLRLAKIFGMKL